MSSAWFERVKSAIPRGFSRYYIISILQEGPHTGKEIMDRAAGESGGEWKPSPGLIYPLLGRLLDEGLIADSDEDGGAGGRYVLTQKGADTAEDMKKIRDGIDRQIDVLSRLGNAGRFVAADVIERIASIAAILGQNAARMTAEDAERYRRFLRDELARMGERTEDGADGSGPEDGSKDGDKNVEENVDEDETSIPVK